MIITVLALIGFQGEGGSWEKCDIGQVSWIK